MPFFSSHVCSSHFPSYDVKEWTDIPFQMLHPPSLSWKRSVIFAAPVDQTQKNVRVVQELGSENQAAEQEKGAFLETQSLPELLTTNTWIFLPWFPPACRDSCQQGLGHSRASVYFSWHGSRPKQELMAEGKVFLLPQPSSRGGYCRCLWCFRGLAKLLLPFPSAGALLWVELASGSGPCLIPFPYW